MKTKEFIQLLKENESRELIFEFQPGKLVGANYHISEVKNTVIASVDCGGKQNNWNETIIQLWESPAEKNKTDYMTASKALAILDRVHKIRPMDLEAPVKLEYGNEQFHTAQLFINDTLLRDNGLYLSLGIEPALCKAEDCCTPVSISKPLAVAECTPGSGCC